jgi:phosphoketolase
LRSGRLTETWNSYRPLKLPNDWKQFAGKIDEQISPMKAMAKYLTAAIELNPKGFRIFSPDGVFLRSILNAESAQVALIPILAIFRAYFE